MKLIKYAFAIMLFLPATSIAVPILDQVNDTNPYGTVAAPKPYTDAGQSFTVGMSGVLNSVELLGWNQATAFPADREHTLSIYNLDSEYTYDNAIATVSQAADSYLEQWFQFDLSSFNIQVEVGDELLMLWTSDGEFRRRYNSFTYNQGDRFIRNSLYPDGIFVQDRDQIFRTYITPVPEPSTSLLLCIGIILLITIMGGRGQISLWLHLE